VRPQPPRTCAGCLAPLAPPPHLPHSPPKIRLKTGATQAGFSALNLKNHAENQPFIDSERFRAPIVPKIAQIAVDFVKTPLLSHF
jgi:hypothetical protein